MLRSESLPEEDVLSLLLSAVPLSVSGEGKGGTVIQ